MDVAVDRAKAVKVRQSGPTGGGDRCLHRYVDGARSGQWGDHRFDELYADAVISEAASYERLRPKARRRWRLVLVSGSRAGVSGQAGTAEKDGDPSATLARQKFAAVELEACYDSAIQKSEGATRWCN